MSRLRRPAFSITSLLVLIGQLLLALAMLAPLFARFHRQSSSQTSRNNLRQIGIGTHAYHDVRKSFPPTVGKSREAIGTCFFQLLPFVEQEALYRLGNDDWKRVAHRPISLYLDPGDRNAPIGNLFEDRFATTNYAANWLLFLDGGRHIAKIPDGSTNTVMFSTRYQMCNGEPTAWAYNHLHYKAPMFGFYSRARFQVNPLESECDPGLPQAISDRAISALMADVVVRDVSPRCSPFGWSAAIDPEDGRIGTDEFNN